METKQKKRKQLTLDQQAGIAQRWNEILWLEKQQRENLRGIWATEQERIFAMKKKELPFYSA